MKRKTLGFALLLFANIFIDPALYYYVGIPLGMVGLCLVISGLNAK